MTIKYVDKFLNSMTMYRVALYSLLVMALFAVGFGFLGKLAYSGPSLLLSAVALLFFCYFINEAFAKLLQAPATSESAAITALILFFIMQPAGSVTGFAVLFLISLVAMASKYIIAVHAKHIFNPAAFAAVAFGFTQNWGAAWWVANMYMLPVVCVVGFLLVRKTRRFPVFAFFLVGFFVSYFWAIGFGDFFSSLKEAFVSWPIIFFGTVMLIEPSTLPPKNYQRIIYGLGIGFVMGNPFKIIGTTYTTPEITLLAGNIFSFCVSLKRKVVMVFEEKIELAKNCYEFVFSPAKKFQFSSGQYLEWSLPHAKPDMRGIRRYFTIASAPNEKLVRLGIKFNEPSSTFKKYLQSLKKGQSLFAGNLVGDFTLPKNVMSQKYVFIAGGIGITPFSSMIRDLINRGAKADIVLFYANKTKEDVAYMDLLREGEQKIGLRTIHLIDTGNIPMGTIYEKGFLNQDSIKKHVPDFHQRMFYLSGPSAMVDNYTNLIKNMGIASRKIKKDYFPGFA